MGSYGYTNLESAFIFLKLILFEKLDPFINKLVPIKLLFSLALFILISFASFSFISFKLFSIFLFLFSLFPFLSSFPEILLQLISFSEFSLFPELLKWLLLLSLELVLCKGSNLVSSSSFS